MKITLATVHCDPKFTPLALLYLKAYLVERMAFVFDDVQILEFPRKAEVEDVVRQILEREPDIVGLSCYVWNIVTLMAVSRRIKEIQPDSKIVLGGPEVGPLAPSVLHAHPYVDVVVKSEGEVPFSEIVDALSKGEDLARVRGIAFRCGEEIYETAEAFVLKDLNKVPSPHVIRYGNYKGRIICLETQRGCVFNCNFCFYNKDLSIRNRRFSLDRIKEEISFWLNQEVHQIFLMDPVFNLNAARTKEICRFVAQHNHREIPFHTEVWAEFIDEEMAQLFREANFTFLEVGLQTTDAAVLSTVDRRLNLKRFVDGIGHLKKFNVYFELQLIYGLPGESRTSFKRSLDFAASFEPPKLAVYQLMVLPGTELWRKARELNLNFDPEPPYLIRSHPSMNSIDIQYGYKIHRALKDLRMTMTTFVLCKVTKLGFSDIIDEWIDWSDFHDHHHASQSITEKVHNFLRYFCSRNEIPPEFFLASASLEYGAEKLDASTPGIGAGLRPLSPVRV
jgi:anaerobic magnesium-protoporphyrin IX monomethyl ester cyclase